MDEDNKGLYFGNKFYSMDDLVGMENGTVKEYVWYRNGIKMTDTLEKIDNHHVLKTRGIMDRGEFLKSYSVSDLDMNFVYKTRIDPVYGEEI